VSWRWTVVLILFLVGLGFRCTTFRAPHEESDEYIYMTLVVQLDEGHGYTLQGSRILEEGLLDRAQYDRPLFFHPPGGIALYWLFYATFGDRGFYLVPLFCYAVFFGSMLLLAQSLGVSPITVAALSAFSPILAHVSTRFWLDGPLLAFATLAAALFLRAAAAGKTGGAAAAGLVLGFASLIKITAFLIVPGVALLAWFLVDRRSSFPRLLVAWIVPALLVQLPWEIWQWVALGSPFPSWAGKPSATLIAQNPYVRYLTETRSPWIYVTLAARILWTWGPSLLLYLLLWGQEWTRRVGAALLLWIASVVAFHVTVGFFGYSKVLRYIILVTPPSILLFTLVLDEAVRLLRSQRRLVLGAAVSLALIAAGLEIAAGVDASLATERDAMFALVGETH